MNDRLVACKTCGSVFLRTTVTNSGKCQNCGAKGTKIHYENGNTSRSRWYETVEVGE